MYTDFHVPVSAARTLHESMSDSKDFECVIGGQATSRSDNVRSALCIARDNASEHELGDIV